MGYLKSLLFWGETGLAMIYSSSFLSLLGAFLNILTYLLMGLTSLLITGRSVFSLELS